MPSAVPKVEIWVSAAETLAFSVLPLILGRTMPARMARIVSTRSNSTSVNAFRRRVAVFLCFGDMSFIMGSFSSFDILLHREDRKKHPDENGSNKSSDEKKHHRFQEGHRSLKVPVQVPFRHA